jgi:hypothetical protein
MPIKFVTKVSCDSPGCTNTAEFPIYISFDRGCSPFGGDMCDAHLELDNAFVKHEDRWHELTDNKIICPDCWNDV